MGSSVRAFGGHRRLLAGRWLPLSLFNLDTDLGYEPDMLAGLQVRKRGLTDALAEEGVLTLDVRHQDAVDALFWQRATYRQAGRMLAGVRVSERLATLEELVWEQWQDDRPGTTAFMLSRDPTWREPSGPPERRGASPNGYHPEEVARLRREALRQLREWCEKWVETELRAAEVDDALEEAS